MIRIAGCSSSSMKLLVGMPLRSIYVRPTIQSQILACRHHVGNNRVITIDNPFPTSHPTALSVFPLTPLPIAMQCSRTLFSLQLLRSEPVAQAGVGILESGTRLLYSLLCMPQKYDFQTTADDPRWTAEANETLNSTTPALRYHCCFCCCCLPKLVRAAASFLNSSGDAPAAPAVLGALLLVGSAALIFAPPYTATEGEPKQHIQ